MSINNREKFKLPETLSEAQQMAVNLLEKIESIENQLLSPPVSALQGDAGEWKQRALTSKRIAEQQLFILHGWIREKADVGSSRLSARINDMCDILSLCHKLLASLVAKGVKFSPEETALLVRVDGLVVGTAFIDKPIGEPIFPNNLLALARRCRQGDPQLRMVVSSRIVKLSHDPVDFDLLATDLAAYLRVYASKITDDALVYAIEAYLENGRVDSAITVMKKLPNRDGSLVLLRMWCRVFALTKNAKHLERARVLAEAFAKDFISAMAWASIFSVSGENKDWEQVLKYLAFSNHEEVAKVDIARRNIVVTLSRANRLDLAKTVLGWIEDPLQKIPAIRAVNKLSPQKEYVEEALKVAQKNGVINSATFIDLARIALANEDAAVLGNLAMTDDPTLRCYALSLASTIKQDGQEKNLDDARSVAADLLEHRGAKLGNKGLEVFVWALARSGAIDEACAVAGMLTDHLLRCHAYLVIEAVQAGKTTLD
jgi:hypothetical protein